MPALSTLIQHLAVVSGDKNDNRQISDISTDSRSVSQGALFFAIPGVHVDGHDFVAQVIDSGAAAIIHERELPLNVQAHALKKNVALIRVEFARIALSSVSAEWFGRPSDKLVLVGVTGTDGKSSTVYYTHQLLQACGIASGFFSTVAMQCEDTVEANGLRQSTPEAPELHGILARMVRAGKTHAVIETTSHGLSYRTSRLRDLRFQAGGFTNLSHEHLEFHGSFEQYRSDKANLFRDLKAREKPDIRPFGVVNIGDPNGWYFIDECPYPVRTYESELSYRTHLDGGRPALFARNVVGAPDHCTATLEYTRPDGHTSSYDMRIPLPGTFNIENVMAAMLLVAGVLGKSPVELLPLLSGLKGVKGRMLPVQHGQPFSVVVDYAHTPGAYEKVLPMFRKSATRRLLAVFGSAGERDVEKRPMQGALAARYCDELFVTNEDPRLEDEMAIIDAIEAGARVEKPEVKVNKIPDRKSAIRAAFQAAGPGDLVVLLGKGHEQSIFYPDGKRYWDEESAAREILVELGWPLPEINGDSTNIRK